MDDAIDAIRRFNRFYTRAVGALDASFLGSGAGLPGARVLHEVARAGTDGAPVAAASLQAELGLEAAYFRRLVAGLETRGWVVREADPADDRATRIALTEQGRTLAAELDRKQHQAIAAMLEPLGPVQRADLVSSLGTARLLLDPGTEATVAIRPFRTGDMGAIAARQSLLYQESQGWGRALEIIEGEVTTDFLRDFAPGRDQCWVAELDGAMAGSVFLTGLDLEGGKAARLRLLYVEPLARGRGIGDRLVGACIGFAREAGYHSVTLWTHTVLETARRLYARHGFVLVETAMHDSFGTPVQGETWTLALD